MNEMRPISIQSRYQNVECGYCGEGVTMDLDDKTTADPNAHADDCPRADMPDPREMSSGERRRAAASAMNRRAAAYRHANGIPDAGR